MTLLQHHVLALSLTAVTTFGVGLLVFLTEPKRRLNQIFALYTLAISGWAIEEALLVGASTQATANLVWRYIGWQFVFFIGPTFLHTAVLSTEESRKTPRRILAIGYVMSTIFLILQFIDPTLLTQPPRPIGYVRFHHQVAPLGIVVPLTFFILVNVALWTLWRGYRHGTGQRKTQMKYLFWASVIGYLGGSPSWCFVFGFHLPLLSPFGLYGVSCYSLAMTYAVFQHKLFDVNLVIRKSLVYSLLVTVLTVGYFGLVYAAEWLFRERLGYQSVWFSLAAFALMALLFQPLKVGIQRLIDWFFFRAPHEAVVRRMERLEQEVRHADKLKAISTLAAGMAHEIKNPLTSIKTFASFLPEKGTDPEFQQKFQRIVTQEVDKIDRIVRGLLDFAKPAQPNLASTRASKLLDETLDVLSNECLTRRVEVRRAYTTEDIIQADPQQLRQVFLNLFLNSLEAMNGHGGRLVVSTARQDRSLTVTIADSGCGISKEQLTHIFDPFFTTKSSGTGLGLSIVHGIIKEHRGTIAFDSDGHSGACCTMTFPLGRQK